MIIHTLPFCKIQLASLEDSMHKPSIPVTRTTFTLSKVMRLHLQIHSYITHLSLKTSFDD